jgi:hypothetical protein
MERRRTFLALALGVLATTGLAGLSLRAQSREGAEAPGARPGGSAGAPVSVQDALTRPFDFPFAKETRIEEVAAQLSKALHAPVVLDRAAMDRADVRPDDTVQLELKGVRLKTGLRLLLDQLDMTYRVEAEDNLLVFTDARGAGDPVNKVLSEIEALHRDVHSLQDAVDDLRKGLGLGEEGEKLRKPTIIEEVPPGGEPKKGRTRPPAEVPPARSRPGI